MQTTDYNDVESERSSRRKKKTAQRCSFICPSLEAAFSTFAKV